MSACSMGAMCCVEVDYIAEVSKMVIAEPPHDQ